MLQCYKLLCSNTVFKMTTALVKIVTNIIVCFCLFVCFSPSTRKSPNLEDLPLEHVAGDKYIYEEILGLKFRISPHAFFQVRVILSF